MSAYRVKFIFRPDERLTIDGTEFSAWGGRAVAATWEEAVLSVAASAPRPIASRVYGALLREDFTCLNEADGAERSQLVSIVGRSSHRDGWDG